MSSITSGLHPEAIQCLLLPLAHRLARCIFWFHTATPEITHDGLLVGKHIDNVIRAIETEVLHRSANTGNLMKAIRKFGDGR